MDIMLSFVHTRSSMVARLAVVALGVPAYGSLEHAQALPMADVIFVIDTSGSMDEEAAAFQNSVNQLAAAAEQNLIDLSVVLIAGTEVCVPPPLGSGNCASDKNLPRYRHIITSVGSNDALIVLINTYPLWAASLRPGATRAIVVISDDDSDMSANQFESMLLSRDAGFANYRFHGAVADFVISPTDQCFLSGRGAAAGTVYLDLITRTGGTFTNLCAGGSSGGQVDAAILAISADVIEVTGPGTPPSDCNGDNRVDAYDVAQFQNCYTGADGGPIPPSCACVDRDRDGDVDANDWKLFVQAITGP